MGTAGDMSGESLVVVCVESGVARVGGPVGDAPLVREAAARTESKPLGSAS
jgi:hypothetical protein